jgi:hypothetical protein
VGLPLSHAAEHAARVQLWRLGVTCLLVSATSMPASDTLRAVANVLLGCALIFWRGWSVLRTLGACALAGLAIGLGATLT